MKYNKLKLVFPILTIVSMLMFLCACGVNPTQTVEALLPIIASIVGIAGSVGEALLPAEASLIGAGQALVINGLNALLTTLKGYDANKTAPGALPAVQAAFNAVHSNLSDLLTAAKVKDPVTAQKIGAVVNGAIATLGTVEAYIVSKHPDGSSNPPATS